jgi:hypothetical protein
MISYNEYVQKHGSRQKTIEFVDKKILPPIMKILLASFLLLAGFKVLSYVFDVVYIDKISWLYVSFPLLIIIALLIFYYGVIRVCLDSPLIAAIILWSMAAICLIYPNFHDGGIFPVILFPVLFLVGFEIFIFVAWIFLALIFGFFYGGNNPYEGVFIKKAYPFEEKVYMVERIFVSVIIIAVIVYMNIESISGYVVKLTSLLGFL